ncbi:MAG: UDP-N-acetylmuramate:L-alanyl-gamma-D-glutamyl-meso-diaminopimelate ligase [Xanthomonadales bacterium]|nr:UDP-N-acetylmuramate:L-alanyl-gamma-D-glutamyl-meso-diaminopimelate ligase [Xanthomonadales bacterium]
MSTAPVHILGVCGTFMGGLAALATELQLAVSGSDQQVYPPMSLQLQALGIDLREGYSADHLGPEGAEILVGNALSRGNPAVEAVLDRGLPYRSGPQWLAERVLAGRRTLAVCGTHGKTTTTSILAFLLDRAGRDPGFLIGGVAHDFPKSARLGSGDCFVVEGDEYDSAFFDKRSKFIHYRPEVAILNNLEFDHADIFDDLAAIERQFHHLVRVVPRCGRLIVHAGDAALERVLAKGCWTPVERFSIDPAIPAEWQAEVSADGGEFALSLRGQKMGRAQWALRGRHNVANAVAAIAAAAAVGVDPTTSLRLLPAFRGVRRRLEHLGRAGGVEILEDFAHHPTAVAVTIDAARALAGNGRLIVALEPRSNSMRLGAHRDGLAPALAGADLAFVVERPELPWDASGAISPLGGRGRTSPGSDALLATLLQTVQPGDHVVFMSNGSFDNLPRRLLAELGNANPVV